MFPSSLTSSLRAVKILALDSVGPNLESVIAFLTCFPCTEKLYIEVRFKSAMYICYDSSVFPIMQTLYIVDTYIYFVFVDNNRVEITEKWAEV